MDYDTQRHYTHAVPMTASIVGERVSLAFRVKADRGPRAGGSGQRPLSLAARPDGTMTA